MVQAIPFGLQHVLAMFVSNITPIIILAVILNLVLPKQKNITNKDNIL